MVGSANLGAIASVLAVVCKCGCNNSQQRWPIARVGLSREVVALLSPRRPCVMHVRGPSNVEKAAKMVPTLLCYFAVITEQKKCLELWAQVWTVWNFAQQLPTTLNNMQHHVQTNATCGYPTMLRVVDQQCCVRTLLFKKRFLPEILQILILSRKLILWVVH